MSNRKPLILDNKEISGKQLWFSATCFRFFVCLAVLLRRLSNPLGGGCVGVSRRVGYKEGSSPIPVPNLSPRATNLNKWKGNERDMEWTSRETKGT